MGNEETRSISVSTMDTTVTVASTAARDDLNKLKKIAKELLDKYSNRI